MKPWTKAITSRPIREDDRPFLSRLYASTRREELEVAPWTEEQKREFLQSQFDVQHKYYMEHFPQAEFSIIEMGGQPVGRIYIDRRQDEIRLVDIALLPDYRGQGLGGSLMRDVLEEGQKAAKPVRIHVEHNNPAMRLYNRLGFRRIDDNGIYHLMEWSPEGSKE